MPDHSLPSDNSTTGTAVERLARFVAEARLEPGPTEIQTIRDALIDTMGCIHVGAGQAVSRNLRAALGGNGPAVAPVFATGTRAAPATATCLNATAAHALDFDDWELPGNTHPSAVLFPALFAAAAGKCLSARALIEAYLVGFEVICRVGEAVNFDHYARGWHSTATLGPIGAAAAVARFLGLDRDRCGHAMAIAVSRAAGYTCQFGSNSKPLQAGFGAESGFVAATLAAHGLTGQRHVLDGPTGFNALTASGDATRFDGPLRRLGQPLALEEFGLLAKLYPSCGYTHRIIDCALALRRRGGIDPADIARITLTLPDFHAAILPFRHPTDRIEALFSLPYCAAQALLTGDVSLASLDAEEWKAPAVADLIDKTEVRTFKPHDPTLNYDPAEPDKMSVEMRDGTVHRAEMPFPLGSPGHPASFEQIADKFRANAGIAAGDPDDRRLRALARLEDWPDIRDLTEILDDLGAPS